MRALRILHIEDSEEDTLLFGRACEAVGLSATFSVVRDGFEAVAYIKGQGKFSDRERFPQPDLIVLDLKMPGMDGFDFLRWLRHEAGLLLLPVLVFTHSTSMEDKLRARKEGATGYFVKPKDFETLVRLVESFRDIGTNGSEKNEQTT